MTNKVGGRITDISKASGGLSGGLSKTPRTLRISESAAHAATTSQTDKVLVDVFVIDPSFCDIKVTPFTRVTLGGSDAASCSQFTHPAF
jgi:hypothetical protein